MDMMLTAIIGGIILGGIVIGGAYFFFIYTRPKKITWNARVYIVTDGKKSINNLSLHDLIPYTTDVVEKEYKDKGEVIYRLQKLNRTIPPITDDAIENWGEKNKCVLILLKGEICTILKKGYDAATGISLFNPVSYDRLSLITHETIIRKERREMPKKDLLAALAPYFMAALIFVALVANGYFLSKSFISVSENQAESAKTFSEGTNKLASQVDKLINYVVYKERLETEDLIKLRNETIIKEELPPPMITG
jgi:hypothetical protein